MNRWVLLGCGLGMAAVGLCCEEAEDDTSSILTLQPVGRFVHATELDVGAAEIVAFDPGSSRAFVTNANRQGVDVLDLSSPASPTLIDTIDVSSLGDGLNSVAVSEGRVAVAIEVVDDVEDDRQLDGLVAFFDATTLAQLATVTVGPLPDMVTFTPDGSRLLVANEGEPSEDFTFNPPGSVSIVDLPADLSQLTQNDVTRLGFEDFDEGGPRASEYPSEIRDIFLGAPRSQQLEPEFIAVAPNGSQAWVTLQENNAVAILDLTSDRVEAIVELGTKNHDLLGNALDPSDRDGGVAIANWPVFSMFQPDGIQAFRGPEGTTFYVTANEGDGVEYEAFEEVERVAELTLDDDAFFDPATLQLESNLGRLEVTNTLGDDDGDGDFDRLVALGARSFSIWAGAGQRLFDSGEDFERRTAALFANDFNNDNDVNEGDSRSDDAGPEPEGIAVGTVDGRTFVFIGLERIGGVMVYDVSQPTSPIFQSYRNDRSFTAPLTDDDLGPEGLAFISAADSPSGIPLLLVSHEVTGTTVIYELGFVSL